MNNTLWAKQIKKKTYNLILSSCTNFNDGKNKISFFDLSFLSFEFCYDLTSLANHSSNILLPLKDVIRISTFRFYIRNNLFADCWIQQNKLTLQFQTFHEICNLYVSKKRGYPALFFNLLCGRLPSKLISALHLKNINTFNILLGRKITINALCTF